MSGKHNDKGKINHVHLFLAENTKAYIKHYIKNDTLARNFTIEKIVDGELVYFLKSEELKWLGPPNRWRIKNYEIRTFNGMKETH